jgi:hypothetical protein
MTSVSDGYFYEWLGIKQTNIPVPASLGSAASLDQSSGDLAVPGCSGLKLAYNENKNVQDRISRQTE